MTVLVAGETLVDFLPAETGPLRDVGTFRRRPGGAPANVAVGLTRLEVDARLWTRLGGDPFGDFLAATLADAGLSDEFVVRDADAKATLAFVARNAGGDPTFSFRREGTADARMEPGRVDAELDRFGWVHVGGVSLSADPARTAALDLAERASAAGATVSFDPNARPELWADSPFDFADSVCRALEHADVVKATPSDLAAAGFDGDPATLARELVASGPHTALLTLGADGAVAHATADAPWATATTTERHPGYRVDAVDATGAGDAFVAGAVTSLSAGQSLDSALPFANRVAALTTTDEGAMAALPTREAVRSFEGRG